MRSKFKLSSSFLTESQDEHRYQLSALQRQVRHQAQPRPPHQDGSPQDVRLHQMSQLLNPHQVEDGRTLQESSQPIDDIRRPIKE